MSSAALYHATILDRDRAPRHYGPLALATHQATLDNPLCGDVVTFRLVMSPAAPDAPEGHMSFDAAAALGASAAAAALGASAAAAALDATAAAAALGASAAPAASRRILTAAFEGRGCALSRASASLWAELLAARAPAEPAEVRALLERFTRFVAEPVGAPLPEELGELVVLAGVRAVKSRRVCATLASRALAEALASH